MSRFVSGSRNSEVNRGIAVSVVTRLRAGRPGLDSRQGQVFFFFFATASRLALGPSHPPIQGGSFPGGKAVGA
jgi:hypothetical protein